MSLSTPNHQLTVNDLCTLVYRDAEELAQAAACHARNCLLSAVEQRGEAASILATGSSQRRCLDYLTRDPAIDWSKITLFHLDEFLGIGAEHPGSFQAELRDRVAARVTPRHFHYLHGNTTDPQAEGDRYAALLQAQPIDLCLLGIGDNGHLAFNEPQAADFDDPAWVKVVRLDPLTRQQQLKSGHFASLAAVPTTALTVTFTALRAASKLLCLAPGSHKAKIVATALTGEISARCPASYLRQLPQATLYLDGESYSHC
jgi:glucosamine-6-phosphate deaminase